MDISSSNSYSVHLLGYAHTLNNNTQYNRGGQMVAFVNLTRADLPEAKDTREPDRLWSAIKKIAGSGALEGGRPVLIR